MTWTNGRHAYRGLRNSAGQRKMSKILKGLKMTWRDVGQMWQDVEKENNTQNYEGEGYPSNIQSEK